MEKKIQLIKLLSIDDLPQPHSSWSEIFYLASSFLAYKYWGSFEKTAEIRKTRDRSPRQAAVPCFIEVMGGARLAKLGTTN